MITYQWDPEFYADRYQDALELAEELNRPEPVKRETPCRCEAYPFPHRPGGGGCGYLADEAAFDSRIPATYWP